MGGFARRTSYWNAFAGKYPGQPFLKLDGGSVFANGTAEAPIVNRWMVEGTYRSNLDALNLSSWDLPIWQELGDLAKAGQLSTQWLKVPLVSANVTPRVPNFPEVQRYVIKEYPLDPKSGRRGRVGITGLLYDPEERLSRTDFQIEKPEQAVRRVIDELRGKTEYRVVLTDTDIGRAISLAVAVPEINLILVAHNYMAASEAQQVGDTLVVIQVNEGRMLSEIRVGVDPPSSKLTVQSRFIPLDRTIPDEPAMGDLQRKAEAQLEEFKKVK